MAEKKIVKKKKKISISTIIVLAIMILGWYIATFPLTADLLNKIYNVNAIGSYEGITAQYTDEEIESILDECKKYNESIYAEQKKTPFHYRGPTSTGETYLRLPTKSLEISTLQIPSIDVNVGVAHGTNDAVLQSEAGHLYGTSLPIEGENVHSVIAAHSALSTAKLFTDLGKVKKGDKFYVTTLNRKLEYKVDNIVTCLPEDDYKYEQVTPGKNYVTLYTCTPYGVNTHRLLVRGELVGSTIVEGQEGGFLTPEVVATIKYASLVALIILAPFISMLIYIIADDKKRKKKAAAKKKQLEERSSDV